LFWENLVIAMIGEQFRCESEINGLVISLRPNSDTISLWIRSAKDAQKVQMVKEDIENFIKIEEGMRLDFEIFSELKSKAESGE